MGGKEGFREDCGPRTIRALRALEPDVPWSFDILKLRQRCYRGALAEPANRDWKEFETAEPEKLVSP